MAFILYRFLFFIFICNNSMHTLLIYNGLFICGMDLNLDDRTRKFGASRLMNTVRYSSELTSCRLPNSLAGLHFLGYSEIRPETGTP